MLIVLYGNCQLIIHCYDKLLKNLSNHTIIPYVNHDRLNTHTLKNIDSNHLKNCNVFIYQPLNDNHGVYSTNYILNFLSEKCIKISIPYIYNSAIYSVYYENATPKWRIGTLYNCGWKNIIIMMKDDLKLNDILDKYDNNEIDFYFEERFDICIKSLKEKEKDCSIKPSNFILDNYKDKRLFVTQNHLTDYFTTWICNEILNILNLDTLIINNVMNDIIEEDCVNDKYNLSYHNFNYDLIYNNELSKLKITNFYNYFNKKLNELNIDNLKPYIISNNQPEKFIDHNL